MKSSKTLETGWFISIFDAQLVTPRGLNLVQPEVLISATPVPNVSQGADNGEMHLCIENFIFYKILAVQDML